MNSTFAMVHLQCNLEIFTSGITQPLVTEQYSKAVTMSQQERQRNLAIMCVADA